MSIRKLPATDLYVVDPSRTMPEVVRQCAEIILAEEGLLYKSENSRGELTQFLVNTIEREVVLLKIDTKGE